MTKAVEFFFDFMSPPSYLAWTQMPGIIGRTGAEVKYRPMYTIGLHDIVGNQSPVMVPNKGKWIGGDLHRYAKDYGVTLNMNPNGFIKILPASRAAALAEREGDLEKLMSVIFPAMFVDGLNLSDVEVVGALILKAGLDSIRYLDAIRTDEVKELLKSNTHEAADRGAFGAPTFFVGDNMHFGQDRLHFVEQDLAP
jgi:2-hydroxychromene-2-carboxylate isomerase